MKRELFLQLFFHDTHYYPISFIIIVLDRKRDYNNDNINGIAVFLSKTITNYNLQ